MSDSMDGPSIQFCPNPFKWLDVTAWGPGHWVKLAFCIRCWSGPASDLAHLSFEDAAKLDIVALWNGEQIQQARHDMLSGWPSFCNACNRRVGGYLPCQPRPATMPPVVNAGPTTLNLAYDYSCNLACPSCRPNHNLYGRGCREYEAMLAFQNACVRPLLKTATRAFLAGQGDPFGSPCYWDMLSTIQPEEAPDLKWYILTNGLGFSESNYEAIPTRAQIDSAQFSIDAATPDTYAANRGGSWGRLLANMAFVADLRRAGILAKWEVSMVVQANNYREAPAFVAMAKEYGCDGVIFNSLLRQVYSEEEYHERAVLRPWHPERDRATSVLNDVKDTPGINVFVEIPRE